VRTSHGMGLALRTVVGTAWAGAMTVSGAGALISSSGLMNVVPAVRVAIGVTLLSGGMFVFMILVADRWFPRAKRSMIWTVEALCFAAFLGAPLAAAALLLI
jgi:hypothetical protein